MASATKNIEISNEERLKALSERDRKIVEALLSGNAREDVARENKLTTERVRQISQPFQSQIRANRAEVRQARRKKDRAQRLSEVKDLAESNSNLRIAALVDLVGGGVTRQDVIDVIGEEDALRREQLRFVEDPSVKPKFTDEDCFEALRAAAVRAGELEGKENGEYGTLTMVLYAEIAPEDAPKQITIQKRFGTWLSACEQAGILVDVQPRLPRREYAKTWSDEELRDILRRFFEDVGVFGSMRDYADWSRVNAGTPTIATVRGRFGSWTSVKEIAKDLAAAS